jgi:hypothetical protein
MNIIPAQLIGKVITDCYQSDVNEATVEFSDGTKIKIYTERIEISGKAHYSSEDFLKLIL